MHRTGILVSLGIVSLACLPAQVPTVMDVGYVTPTPILAAPGQVTTLYIAGTKTVLPASVQATTLPLPTSLGGFSVTVRQGGNSYSAPLISVTQATTCTDAGTPTPQCIITGLTLQVPAELSGLTDKKVDLSVNDNGTESAHFQMVLMIDRIHVLSSCDNKGYAYYSPGVTPDCPSIVAHADGTLVSGSSPAKGGETVVVYAYGLGQTTPAVPSGTATPTPAPTVFWTGVNVQFDFRPNAEPAIPDRSSSATGTGPYGRRTANFAGLTPGQVGLYQINVRLPDTLPSIPACDTGGVFSSLGEPISSHVFSNLTIDMSLMNSFDGAKICVQAAQ